MGQDLNHNTLQQRPCDYKPFAEAIFRFTAGNADLSVMMCTVTFLWFPNTSTLYEVRRQSGTKTRSGATMSLFLGNDSNLLLTCLILSGAGNRTDGNVGVGIGVTAAAAVVAAAAAAVVVVVVLVKLGKISKLKTFSL